MFISLRSDQEAAVETQSLAVGVAVVSEEAATAGVASIPTPFSEPGSDLWFLHQVMFGGESRLVDKFAPPTTLHIDSRAMRKVPEGGDVAFVGEGMSGGSAGGMIYGMAVRMLIKLH